MKVKNISNGQTAHVPNNDPSVLALIQLGVLEVVKEEPKPKEVIPEWSCVTKINEKTLTPMLYIRHHMITGTTYYNGSPDKAAQGFFYWQWSGEAQANVFTGPVPPADVIAQYKSLYVGAVDDGFTPAPGFVNPNSQDGIYVQTAFQKEKPREDYREPGKFNPVPPKRWGGKGAKQ
jgi:hypothetical protein